MHPKLRTLLVLAFLLSLAFAGSALHAQTTGNQTTRNVGSGQPYTTIQSAIDASTNGDTVLVYPGTYFENIDFKGKAITVTSTPAPTGGAANTIIDGGGKGSTVTFQTNEPRTAILTGFTITHGGISSPQDYVTPQAGILIKQSEPTLLNNVITQNYCQGIESEYSGALIQGNTISSSLTPERCSVLQTGGIRIENDYQPIPSQPSIPTQVIGNIIDGNTTGQSGDGGGDGGAGIAAEGGATVILGNILRNNVTLSGNGGAINLVFAQNVAIAQNLIYNNKSGCGGGAISLDFPDTTALIVNNTMVGNTGGTGGGYSNCSPSSTVYNYLGNTGGILVNNIIDGNTSYPELDCTAYEYVYSALSEYAQPILDHNLFYNAGGSILDSHGCVDTSAKYGNLVADPKFANPATNDFHLTKGSPAIDAGNGSALALLKNINGLNLTTDFDGNPREQDATGKGYNIIDIGAYEFGGNIDTLPTRVVVSVSPTPATAGPYTLTATLSSGLGIPTGTVTFLVDGQAIGSAPIQNGVATLTNALLIPGVHSIVATYAGNAGFPPAVSVVVIVQIDKYTTSVTLTGTPSPYTILVGQTFTANIHASSSDPNYVPSPVTLTLDNASAPTATLLPDASGNASWSTSTLPLGYHNLNASYAGDSLHASASASITIQVVNGLPTTTTLTSSSNPSNYNQPVTFTAKVAAPGSSSTPTGAILFADGHTTLATVTLDASGIATYTTSSLTANDPGTSAYHQISAVFVPAATFATSSASLNQTVNGLPSVAALTITPGSGTPFTTFTLTATVSSGTTSSTALPTGRVLFYTSTQTGSTGNEIGYANLTNGVATFTSTGFLGGTDYVLAVYPGDTTYAQANSNDVALTITAPSTTTTAAVTPQTTTYGQPELFSAHVTGANGPTGSIPTGQVEFDFCHGARTVVPLDASGNASYLYPTPNALAEPVGSCPFTVTYLGDANYPKSTSAAVAWNVRPSGSATTLTSSAAAGYFSQPITFTATITGTAAPVLGPGGTILQPTGVAPSGTVQFFANGTLLGASPVANNTATLTSTTLPVGTNTLTAVYSGDANLGGSSSGPISEVISLPDFSISAPQPSLTIQSRHKGSLTLNFASLSGFNGPVVVTCAMPLPEWLTCEPPSPNVQLPLNGTATATLTLDTDGVPNWYGELRPGSPTPNSLPGSSTPTSRPSSPASSSRFGSGIALAGLSLLPLLTLRSTSRRSRRLRQWLTMILVATATLSLSSCANKLPDHTAPGTYTIQLQATGQSTNVPVATTHTLSITLLVTPE